MPTKTAAVTPVNSLDEVIAGEARLALLKENGFVRGWRAAGEPEVVAIVEERNARERERCKAAFLARFAAQ